MGNEANGGDSLITPQPETTPWYGTEYSKLVEAKGWKDPKDAVKSYSELEKAMGSRVKMPTPESSAEEIRQFYQKTGCPENPDGYEIKVPEQLAPLRDADTEKILRQIAYENGVSKQAFEAIAKTYWDQWVTGMEKSREQGEIQLKQEFGDKYEEQIKIAQRFAGQFSDEFKKLMEVTGLGNNPVVVKEFVNLGKKTMNDTLIRGNAGANEPEYEPKFKNSPAMYATGEDEESKKARAWFEARGHRY